MQLRSIYCTTAILLCLGCSSPLPTKQINIGKSTLLAASAGSGFTTIKTVDNNEIMCVRMGPDATSDTNRDFNFGITLARSQSDQSGSGSGDNQVEMIGRTPTNVLVRDLLYQTCIMRQSKLITDAQYQSYVSMILKEGFKLSEKELDVLKIEIKSHSAGAATAFTKPQSLPSYSYPSPSYSSYDTGSSPGEIDPSQSSPPPPPPPV